MRLKSRQIPLPTWLDTAISELEVVVMFYGGETNLPRAAKLATGWYILPLYYNIRRH